jgi:predicted esterase
MTREDRASEIADYIEYLDALHDDVMADPSRQGATVNVLGFSQGTATATRWIMHGRARVHRLVLWGGLIPPDSDVTRGHSALRHIPLTLVLGERDQYVSDEMLTEECARLDRAHIPYETVRFAGGHAISRSVFPRLAGS